MSRSYVVSNGAAADLRDITQYTLKTWSEEQRRAYIAALENRAEALAKGEGVFRDMSFVMPGLRMVLSGKHYIFCMPQEGKPSVILAILHERMDLLERLKHRLR